MTPNAAGTSMTERAEKKGCQKIGRYLLLEKLGSGSMGTVFRAEDTKNGEQVAVKVLYPTIAKDETRRQRFQQEFDATRSLQHPNIVRALDLGQERSFIYLVMEFVQGTTLWNKIQGKPLSEAETIDLIGQVAKALHHAHVHGLIHRDVKPDNILVTPDGTARLADFGLVKQIEGGLNLTETASVLGTPNFMAPEQFEDARRVDSRIDLYALAATAYTCLTGIMPFQSRGYMSMVKKKLEGDLIPPRQHAPEVSERAESAIICALSVDPQQRQASCQDFMEELTGKPFDYQVLPEKKTNQKLPHDERRASVRFSCDLPGGCAPFGNPRADRWKARVCNISAGGLCLVLARRFEPGTMLEIELTTPGEYPPKLLAQVVHVHSDERGSWAVGCRFVSELSPEALEELLQADNPAFSFI